MLSTTFKGFTVLIVLIVALDTVEARCNSDGCCWCNDQGYVVRAGRYGPQCNSGCEYCKCTLYQNFQELCNLNTFLIDCPDWCNGQCTWHGCSSCGHCTYKHRCVQSKYIIIWCNIIQTGPNHCICVIRHFEISKFFWAQFHHKPSLYVQ